MINKIYIRYKQTPIQVRASFWFLICAFLQRGISVITTPIFTRILSTSEYGQFNVFNSWLGIVSIFVSLNLSMGVYAQGLVKYDNDRERFSSSLEGLMTTMVVAWTIIYLLTRNFWNELFSLTTVQMLLMFVMIWTSCVFRYWSSYQRVEFKYKALVILTLIVSIAKPFVGILFVIKANDKVTARILGLALVELMCFTYLYISQMKRGKQFFSAKYWKYAIVFNLPLVPHYLSQVVLSSSDRIMIGNIVGDSQTGIYSLAYSLSSIMVLFNTALMQTLSPWIYQKIKAKKIKDIEPIAYLSLIIIAVVNLCLIIFAPEAVAIFAPKEYYDAVWVIPPVAMSVYFMYSYDLFAKFAFYHEKTKLIMMASVIGAVLNVVLNYIFIGMYGYVAAGYTTLACYLIYSVAHYMLMNKICVTYCDGVRPYSTKKILAITIPFMMAGFGLLFTYNYPVVRYGLIAVGAIAAVIKRNELIAVGKKLIALKKK